MNGVQLAFGFAGALAVVGLASKRGSAARRRLPRVATLFSGGGLVEVGLEGLVEPVFAVEYDPKIAAVYASAHGAHVKAEDVRTVMLPKAGSIDALHASPVCKAFSVAKREVGEKDLDIETARATARGRKLYDALIAHLLTQHPEGVYLVPNRCGSGDTSPDADRVWASLRRSYPHHGLVVFVPPEPQ